MELDYSQSSYYFYPCGRYSVSKICQIYIYLYITCFLDFSSSFNLRSGILQWPHQLYSKVSYTIYGSMVNFSAALQLVMIADIRYVPVCSCLFLYFFMLLFICFLTLPSLYLCVCLFMWNDICACLFIWATLYSCLFLGNNMCPCMFLGKSVCTTVVMWNFVCFTFICEVMILPTSVCLPMCGPICFCEMI